MSRNIVLIGMPGAGKTTVGKMLSEKLGFDFVDMDDFIEKESGKTIPELFDVSENHFRNMESLAVKKISANSNFIIATGGGVVKNRINIEELKKNGVIVFIDRPIENIASDVEISKRPLLKDGVHKLYSLHKERYELYKEYSEFRVVNDKKIEDVVETIMGSDELRKVEA